MPHAPMHEEPQWIQIAQAVYQNQFGSLNRNAVLKAMDEWGEDGEDLFILAHLNYLHLSASRDLLFAHQELFDGIGELIEEQKKATDLLTRLGRFLKRELGELTALLDEDANEPEDNLTDEELKTPELTVLPVASKSEIVSEELNHPVPTEEE